MGRTLRKVFLRLQSMLISCSASHCVAILDKYMNCHVPIDVKMSNQYHDPPYTDVICMVCFCSHWTDIQVKGTSLPRALHCWDRSLHDSNKNGKAPLKGCPIHLIDSCPWPHCNPSCPTIQDQYTGQEMNVIQFLMHMGFDVQKMAQQQGLEPSKLLGMLSSGS